MERAEQLRLRLRAGEEAAAVAAAAAKADAGEEEAVASLHGSGGMGCSLRVLLAHTELCPGPPAGPRRASCTFGGGHTAPRNGGSPPAAGEAAHAAAAGTCQRARAGAARAYARTPLLLSLFRLSAPCVVPALPPPSSLRPPAPSAANKCHDHTQPALHASRPLPPPVPQLLWRPTVARGPSARHGGHCHHQPSCWVI